MSVKFFKNILKVNSVCCKITEKEYIYGTFWFNWPSARPFGFPIIHKRLFDFSKRSGCDYRLFDISPESLPAQIGTLASLRGYNVTIPHKQAIIPYLDQLDSAAERYRAVNVVQNQNGILSGYNTDVTGFLKSVEQLGVSFSGKRILVLGYGGAGRMMATEAAFQGAAEISIAARRASLEKAEKLAVEIRKAVLGCKVTSLPLENVSREYDLIVNSTPSGMYPNINESPLTKKQLIGSKALLTPFIIRLKLV